MQKSLGGLLGKVGAGRDLLNAIEKDLISKDPREKNRSQKDLEKEACEFITFFWWVSLFGFL